MGIRSRVSLDLAEPIERDIKLVGSGEFQHQKVAVEVLHREPTQPLILRDAVLHVHDVVADVQIFQRGEEGGGFALGLRFVPGALREELFFGQDHQSQIGRKKTSRDFAVQD